MTRAVCWSLACALLLSTASQAVTVDEAASRVVLAEEQTTVSLALEHPSDRSALATIRLEWLRPDDTVATEITEERSVRPGRSTVEFAVPLSSDDRGDSRLAWFRLRYQVSGSGIDAGGTMALANVCDEVFELHIAGPQEALAGESFPIQISARHPVSGQPVSGVKLSAKIELQNETLKANATTGSQGLAEIQFTIPADAVEEFPDLDIEARLGDFEEFAYVDLHVIGSTRIQIQTDKPLYQPGQTVHVRLLCLSPAGPARSGLPFEVRILDPEGTAAFVDELTTNRFGVAHFDWRVPDNLRLGDYMIIADPREGGDESYFSRTVKVSRYELPDFSVSAQADRAYYLPGQDAEIEVRANYLFGKPVANADIRLVREFSREWSYAEQRWVVEEGDGWRAQSDASGIARITVPLGDAHRDLAEPDGVQYEDLSFAAYATDPTTGRTEQRRFDLRVSRFAIHIYLTEARDGVRTFVSTSYADGTPASCRILVDGRETARTNSYGLARIAFPGAGRDEVTIKADDGTGRTGREIFDPYHFSWSPDDDPELEVSTARTLHRPGEPIRVEVTSSAPWHTVLLQVLRNHRALSSQWLDLSQKRASLTIPWREEFVHDVTVAVATGHQFDLRASRTVLYPADRNLRVNVRFEREEYRPGEKATVRFDVRTAGGKPVEAALGVAVVDASVGERVRTDAESNYRGWWRSMSDPSTIGGVTWEELSRMDTSGPFSNDLDLVAEAMLARSQHWPNTGTSASYQSGLLRHFGRQFQVQFRDIKALLDARYREGNYVYPRDEAALLHVLAGGGIDLGAMRDPWGSPFRTDFYFHQRLHWLRFVSAGPDKLVDTSDDFTAQAITRPHFEVYQDAMLSPLRRAPSFPANLHGARDLLREAGIDIDGIRDPWGSAYRPRFEISRTKGMLVFDSAGPDREFDTKDDFTVGNISGQYFAATAARLNNTLKETERFPRNLDEWRAAVGEAPMDDAWGNPAYAVFSQSSKYTELQEIYTAATHGGPSRQRIRFRPATQTSRTISLRSAGPDGMPNTPDDFTLAVFNHFERLQEPDEEAAMVPGTPVASGGAIVGAVADASGASIPDAQVTATCPGAPAVRYGGVSNERGYFLITGLPPCLYLVRAASAGFMSFVVSDVRVHEQETTVVDIQMEIGAVTEMVTVSAEPVLLQTTSAQVAMVEDSPAATPRLREYFPETLLWAPDIETGPDGETMLSFPLADSITTWELDVMGSTVDGQLGSGATKVRAFQPFFVDHNPPPVLTQGDEIRLPVTVRNYLETDQLVKAQMEPAPWFELLDRSAREAPVAAGGSANMVFPFRAVRSVDDGRQQVTAIGNGSADAIARTVSVHPDGEEMVIARNRLFRGTAELDAAIPESMIPASLRAELRIYPNQAAHIVDAIEGIMRRPYGCGEQTISSAYPSLLLLQYLKRQELESEAEPRARRFLRLALDRLPGYQMADGGFAYWRDEEAEVHLTAYALGFLVAAREFAPIDEARIGDAVLYLRAEQNESGEWPVSATDPIWRERATLRQTASAAWALSVAGDTEAAVRGIQYLAQKRAHVDDAYMLATIALLADNVGQHALAAEMHSHLRRLAKSGPGGVHWELTGRTPFHGWGRVGQLEVTALAVSALASGQSESDREFVSRGLLYLLRNKDAMGVWWSTQATVCVLEAMMAASGDNAEPSDGEIEISVDGRPVSRVALGSNASKVAGPSRVDLSEHLSAGTHVVSLRRDSGALAQAQLAMRFYRTWPETERRDAPGLRLSVVFDRVEAQVGDTITCAVKAERVGSPGAGMLLGEIGLPPGADVDRSSLDESLGYGRYDILPDRVIVYLWPRAGGTSLEFNFRPRFAQTAKSAPSILYDYYNPEARVVVAPSVFHIKETAAEHMEPQGIPFGMIPGVAYAPRGN